MGVADLVLIESDVMIHPEKRDRTSLDLQHVGVIGCVFAPQFVHLFKGEIQRILISHMLCNAFGSFRGIHQNTRGYFSFYDLIQDLLLSSCSKPCGSAVKSHIDPFNGQMILFVKVVVKKLDGVDQWLYGICIFQSNVAQFVQF